MHHCELPLFLSWHEVSKTGSPLPSPNVSDVLSVLVLLFLQHPTVAGFNLANGKLSWAALMEDGQWVCRPAVSGGGPGDVTRW